MVISDQVTIKPPGGRRSRPPGGLSLPAACWLLAGATLIAAAPVGWHGYLRQQAAGLAAALAAAATCWVSATIALVISGWLAGSPNAVSGILGGTLIRLAGPLLVTAANGAAHTPIFQAGLFGYMVVFFLYTLAVETALLLGLLGGREIANSAAVPGRGKRQEVLSDG